MEKQLHEAAMSPILIAWLKSCGFKVYAEVPFYDGCCDHVAYRERDDLLIACEMKLCATEKLLRQSNRNACMVDMSFGCVQSKPRQSTIERFAHFRVGLLQIEGDTVRLLCEAEHRIDAWRRKDTIQHLPLYGEDGIGGRPNLKGEGPAQECLSRVIAYREEHPKASWDEIFEAVPNHYSNSRSLAGSMRICLGMKRYREAVA